MARGFKKPVKRTKAQINAQRRKIAKTFRGDPNSLSARLGREIRGLLFGEKKPAKKKK